MSLLQWILIGCGGVLLLAGAVVLLIGILAKKPLILWKILPGVVMVGGVALALTVWMGYLGQIRMIQRDNYVSWRLAELENYDESILTAESTYSRMANVDSTRLAVLSLALDGRYSQAVSASQRYQKVYDDATLKDLEDLCTQALSGTSVQADLLMKLKQLGTSLSISDGDKTKAESIVNIQMTVYRGDGTSDLDEDLLNLAGEKDSLSQRTAAQAYMYQGNSQMAYEKLSAAADADASFPSRVLLAQMKADGYTTSQNMTGSDPEKERLEAQVEQKQQELDALQSQIDSQENLGEEEYLRLKQQVAKLEKEVEDLYQQIDSAPILHAVDYILSSSPNKEEELAYHLVLAQLYFRSDDVLKAEENLEQAFALAAEDTTGYLSSEVFRLIEAYDNSQRSVYDDNQTETPETEETEGTGEETTEVTVEQEDPQTAVQELLYAMGKNMTNADVMCTRTTTDAEGNQVETQISFSQFILETLQDIRAGLHIGNVDTSKFPEISVSVNISKTKKNREEYTKEDFTIREMDEEITDFELIPPSEESNSSVCLVVDHSGSMEGQNLEEAKKAVSAFVQSGGSKMRMGLTIFDDTAETLCPITGSTGTVQRAVDGVTSNGGTNIAAGLLEGMRSLETETGNRVIVLLSDGEDSGESAAQMEQVINQLLQQGIVVYAVGFDFADSDYLTHICEATGGKFLRSETSSGLGSVYQTIERFLSQDYVLRFTVKADTQAYDRDLRITMDGGVYDEKEYFVGVSPDRIAQESTLTPQSDYFQQTGGSYQMSKGPEAVQGYLEVIQEMQDRYGVGANRNVEGGVQATGLFLVQMLDFDGDGDNEMLLGYNDSNWIDGDKPEDYSRYTYYEVWGWCGDGVERMSYSQRCNYDKNDWQTIELVTVNGQILFKCQNADQNAVEYLSLQGVYFDTYLSAQGNITEKNDTCYLNGEKVTADEQKKALDTFESQIQDTTVISITQKEGQSTLVEDTEKVIEDLKNRAS